MGDPRFGAGSRSRSAVAWVISQPAPPPPGYQSPDWLPGAGWLHKLSNIYDDAATAGFADTATAKVGDLMRSIGVGNATPDVDTLRAQTAQNRKDVGPVASGVTDVLGYTTGLGKLGAGDALATKLGGGYLARIGGSAAENAGANVLGTVGHGDTDVGDNLRALATGLATGTVTGSLTRGSQAGAPSPTAGLKADTKVAFDPLTTVKYDPGHFGPDFDTVTSGLSSKAKVDMGDALTGATKKISQEMADKFRSGDTITADDVAGFQRTLSRAGSAPGAGPTDPLIARQYSDALDGVVQKAAPTYWGQKAPGADVSGAISAAKTAAN